MSFVRPGAAGAIRRWAEPAAAAALVALAGGFGMRWAGALGWIALAAAALALFWLRAAILGALAARPVTGAGLVVLREGEIGYMGPRSGGFVELDTLFRIEIYRIAAGRDPVWRLVGTEGAELTIPATAEGAGHLPEALTALPGFSDLAAVGALTRDRPGRHVIWQRAGLTRLDSGSPDPAHPTRLNRTEFRRSGGSARTAPGREPPSPPHAPERSCPL